MSKHILIALDCCYSGAAINFRGVGKSVKTPTNFEQKYVTERAHYLLTSARKEAVSEVPSLGMSPFADAFLHFLKQGKGVTIEQVFAGMQERFDRRKLDQRPTLQKVGKGPGSFVFVPKE